MNDVQYSNSNIEIAVREFVAAMCSIPIEKVVLETCLFYGHGIDGDDAADLIKDFSIKFGVSLDRFDFDKHFGPEAASNPIGLIVGLLEQKNSEKLGLKISDLVIAAERGRFPKGPVA